MSEAVAVSPLPEKKVRRKKSSRRREGKKDGKTTDKKRKKKRPFATPESESSFQDPLTPVEATPLNQVKIHEEESDSTLPHSGLSHTRVISLERHIMPHELEAELVEQRHSHELSHPPLKQSSEDVFRVMDLDAGQMVDFDEVSLRPSIPPTPAQKMAPPPRPPPLPPRPKPAASPPAPSTAKSATSSFSLGLTGLGRGLAAGLAAVRGVQPAESDDGHIQHILLPRREVNEAQWAKDVMRFADARDRLHSGKDAESFRQLGMEIEHAWREKLSEGHDLRSSVHKTQDLLEDLEDENGQLRDQLSLLSEQIVHREEDFQAFQRFAVANHARERTVYSENADEEKALALLEVAEAETRLQEQRAFSAQLRLVVHAIKGGRLEVLDKVDVTFEPGGVEPPPAASGSLAPQEAGKAGSVEDEDDVGDDPLYHLPHHAHHATDTTTEERIKPMPLETMRKAGLMEGNAFLCAGEGGDDEDDTASVAAVRVLLDKAAAEASLTDALRQENAALRDNQAAQEKRYKEMEEELALLSEQLAVTEAAVDDVLDG